MSRESKKIGSVSREMSENEGLFHFSGIGERRRTRFRKKLDRAARQKRRRGRKMKNSKGLILYFPVACLHFGQMCNFAHERCLRATIYRIKLYTEGGMIHLCFRIFNFHFSIGQSISYRPVWIEDRSKKRKERARDNKENNKGAPSFLNILHEDCSFFPLFLLFFWKIRVFRIFVVEFRKIKIFNKQFNIVEQSMYRGNVKLTQPTELVVVLQLVLETVDLPLQFAKSERRRCVQSFLMLPKLPFQGRHTPLEGPQHFRLDHPRRGRMSSDDLKKRKYASSSHQTSINRESSAFVLTNSQPLNSILPSK